MAIFLEVHELNAQKPEAFVAAWAARAGSGVHCLKHWVNDDVIALLVEAPNEDSLGAYGSAAAEVTELFAPAPRWLSHEPIELAR